MSSKRHFMPGIGSIYQDRDSRERGERFFMVEDVRDGYALGFSFRKGMPTPGHRPTERRPTRIRIDVLDRRWSYVPNGDIGDSNGA